MSFDPRLTPIRTDLAASYLRGRIDAERYVEGEPAVVTAEVLDMHGRPESGASLTSQLLWGEQVTIYDRSGGFAWVQSGVDGYVGYVPEVGLGERAEGAATHMVTSQHAQLYDAPELKRPPRMSLPNGARLSIVAEESAATVDGGAAETGRYLQLTNGLWCPAQQATALNALSGDFVAHAERYLGVPYLWGGRSVRGLDCSALVQLSLAATGADAPRDSDMLCAIGEAVTRADTRGDLVCWRSHIGIMLDAERLLHCNAHHMRTEIEPLAKAVERIGRTDTGKVIAVRRLRL